MHQNIIITKPNDNHFLNNALNIVDASGEEAIIAGRKLSWWLDNYELPFYIFKSSIIRENIRAFKNVFSHYYPKAQVRYAAKAATHTDIFKIMLAENIGADVASENETMCAIHSGIPTSQLDLNGNCKEDSLIRFAIEKNMLIIADSIEEFILISQIAAGLNKKVNALLRISGFDLNNITDSSVFTSGKWTKFGTPLSDIPEFIKTSVQYPNVELLGFHVHIGSQISQVEPYLYVLGKMIEMGLLLKETGRECKIINLGGGYPISYLNNEEWNEILTKIYQGYISAQKGDFSKVYVWGKRKRRI